jgi:hypothetical protein
MHQRQTPYLREQRHDQNGQRRVQGSRYRTRGDLPDQLLERR